MSFAENLQFISQILEKRIEQIQAHREQRQLIMQILDQYHKVQTEQIKRNQETSYRFNPLEQIPINEVTHSRLLGNFLKRNGTHGQGDLFLTAFLKSIGVESPEKGIWYISIERQNIDLCLRRLAPASVIVIENKSNWAVDQSSQLYRYWAEAIHRPHPGLNYAADSPDRANFQVIYLVPHSAKTPAEQSLSRPVDLHDIPGSLTFPDSLPCPPRKITIYDLCQLWIDECQEHTKPENHRLRTFLEFYQELWNH